MKNRLSFIVVVYIIQIILCFIWLVGNFFLYIFHSYALYLLSRCWPERLWVRGAPRDHNIMDTSGGGSRKTTRTWRRLSLKQYKRAPTQDTEVSEACFFSVFFFFLSFVSRNALLWAICFSLYTRSKWGVGISSNFVISVRHPANAARKTNYLLSMHTYNVYAIYTRTHRSGGGNKGGEKAPRNNPDRWESKRAVKCRKQCLRELAILVCRH